MVGRRTCGDARRAAAPAQPATSARSGQRCQLGRSWRHGAACRSEAAARLTDADHSRRPHASATAGSVAHWSTRGRPRSTVRDPSGSAHCDRGEVDRPRPPATGTARAVDRAGDARAARPAMTRADGAPGGRRVADAARDPALALGPGCAPAAATDASAVRRLRRTGDGTVCGRRGRAEPPSASVPARVGELGRCAGRPGRRPPADAVDVAVGVDERGRAGTAQHRPARPRRLRARDRCRSTTAGVRCDAVDSTRRSARTHGVPGDGRDESCRRRRGRHLRVVDLGRRPGSPDARRLAADPSARRHGHGEGLSGLATRDGPCHGSRRRGRGDAVRRVRHGRPLERRALTRGRAAGSAGVPGRTWRTDACCRAWPGDRRTAAGRRDASSVAADSSSRGSSSPRCASAQPGTAESARRAADWRRSRTARASSSHRTWSSGPARLGDVHRHAAPRDHGPLSQATGRVLA